ncbi:Ankyrin repeat, SAM and basic leucine zipper domain-containing protein 1 [Apodemus speciosus]|uniref:Ankyrin repeat, SAM and basic leucine zipper domain-containing protein 1 n=1 Tax=Apodemus speciosus TaxID=105296 RepID=A0ABQ0EU70_APOSI
MAAAGTLRGLAVAGGGESSDSEDDGWDIGYLDRSSQKLKRSLPVEEKNETFKKALTTGDISLVKELLDSGINVDSSFRYGWTPLMYAASVANVELVRFLLDRGANASFDKERLMTPIMYAARDGHTQVVALLVAHGAEVNAQDENGYTALTWAARQGHKNVILKLLELGANKMLQTKDGRTPSEIAKRNKHLEIFNFLSLTLNPLEGKLQQLTKEETICKLLATDSDKEKDHIFSPYTAFGDLEIFLHGLGLEHMTDVLKETCEERDITLRHLLTMKKDELTKNGITSKDQQKILAALKELEVEEINFGKLPEVAKLEIRNSFQEAICVILISQTLLNTTILNEEKGHQFERKEGIVLEWASPRNFTSVCEELVSNVEDLNEEVCRLKELIQKRCKMNGKMIQLTSH